MSHKVTTDSGNMFAPPLSDWRSERAPTNINYCELPSHILVPNTHTHCCIPDVHGQCWVQFHQSLHCETFCEHQKCYVTPLQQVRTCFCAAAIHGRRGFKCHLAI